VGFSWNWLIELTIEIVVGLITLLL